MPVSAFYVARGRAVADDPLAEVRRLTDAAAGWNARMGITGVLIVTAQHFAHLLEGPRPAVERLLKVVPNDGFHRDVRVLHFGEIESPRFSSWQVGYLGRASYMDRQIAPLLAEQASEAAAQSSDRLMHLLLEMGRADPASRAYQRAE